MELNQVLNVLAVLEEKGIIHGISAYQSPESHIPDRRIWFYRDEELDFLPETWPDMCMRGIVRRALFGPLG